MRQGLTGNENAAERGRVGGAWSVVEILSPIAQRCESAARKSSAGKLRPGSLIGAMSECR